MIKRDRIPEIKKEAEPLSHWPGEAIRQMLHDVRRVERLKSVGLDMRHWAVVHDNGDCEVCIAGAVVMCRPGEKWRGPYENGVAGIYNHRVLAMDAFRKAHWASGLQCFGVPDHIAEVVQRRLWKAYPTECDAIYNDAGDHRSKAWYASLRKISYAMDRMLREAGWAPEEERTDDQT